MLKNKAVMVAVILAIIAVFVVVASTSVFNHDSKERYGEVAPQAPSTNEESAVAPASVKEEMTEPLAQNDAGGMNETVTEHMEDVQEAVPEAVIEDETIATPAPAATEDTADTSSQPAAGGEIHIVKAVGLKYEPMVVEIQPGDTVAWENMPTHDTQSLEGLIPEGAEYWHSPLGENYQRTFSVEGIYVYKCTPHFGAGMGGAVIVGKPVNLDVIMASDAKGAAGRLVRKAIAAAKAM